MRTPLSPGDILNNGRYRIEYSLAVGGFGITYRGFDTRLNSVVAIKEYFPDGCSRGGQTIIPQKWVNKVANIKALSFFISKTDRMSIVPMGAWTEVLLSHHRRRFLEEGKLLSTFKHHGIVTVLNVFEENGTAYMVMELIEGKTLRQYILSCGSRLPIDEVVNITGQLAAALEFVHNAGHLHRDVKPDNVMRRNNGEVILIDFGAAREFTNAGTNSQTALFTPGFAPPEQYTRDGKRGPYTDIYGLAATCYMMLTGKPPRDVMARASGEKIDPISNSRDDVSAELKKAILKGLEIKADDRPANIALFLSLFNHKNNVSPATVIPPKPVVSPIKQTVIPPKPVITPPVIKSLPSTKINHIDGAEMILIPADEFLMGSRNDDKNAKDNEKPQHAVYLDNYYIYKNEVTVAQYRKYCKITGRVMPPTPKWGWLDNHPMVNVTWHDAKAYADWARVALPTEAQWEKAARGTDGRRYPWGNKWDASKCVNKTNSNGRTQPVGSILSGASPYGCLDMVGNVWEWCDEWYDENIYKKEQLKKSVDMKTVKYRVLRGGYCGYYNPDEFRVAYRYGYNPTDWLSYGIGFRCVFRVHEL